MCDTNAYHLTANLILFRLLLPIFFKSTFVLTRIEQRMKRGESFFKWTNPPVASYVSDSTHFIFFLNLYLSCWGVKRAVHFWPTKTFVRFHWASEKPTLPSCTFLEEHVAKEVIKISLMLITHDYTQVTNQDLSARAIRASAAGKISEHF